MNTDSQTYKSDRGKRKVYKYMCMVLLNMTNSFLWSSTLAFYNELSPLAAM